MIFTNLYFVANILLTEMSHLLMIIFKAICNCIYKRDEKRNQSLVNKRIL